MHHAIFPSRTGYAAACEEAVWHLRDGARGSSVETGLIRTLTFDANNTTENPEKWVAQFWVSFLIMGVLIGLLGSVVGVLVVAFCCFLLVAAPGLEPGNTWF